MSPSLLLDMNLSPNWVDFLADAGFTAVHWSQVGAATATDQQIMQFARDHGLVVMTQDLDFSVILALTHANGPSVVQIRTRNARPSRMASVVIPALQA